MKVQIELDNGDLDRVRRALNRLANVIVQEPAIYCAFARAANDLYGHDAAQGDDGDDDGGEGPLDA